MKICNVDNKISVEYRGQRKTAIYKQGAKEFRYVQLIIGDNKQETFYYVHYGQTIGITDIKNIAERIKRSEKSIIKLREKMKELSTHTEKEIAEVRKDYTRALNEFKKAYMI
jgi:hypothetical protein